MDDINKPKTDIMDQIASYSQQEIENFYYMLKDEHESQEKLNKVLKEKNIDTFSVGFKYITPLAIPTNIIFSPI